MTIYVSSLAVAVAQTSDWTDYDTRFKKKKKIKAFL